MDFLTNLQSEITQALKSRESIKLQTLRLLSSALHNEKIAQGKELSEDAICSVIKREAKKRKEALVSFKAAGRDESARKEEAELKILEAYLPEMMSEADIIKLVEKTIADHPEANTGQIISAIMKQAAGQADGSLVAQIVNKKISQNN